MEINLKKIVKFGKHKGKTVEYIKTYDFSYYNWALQNAPEMFKDKVGESEGDKIKQELKDSEWVRNLKPNTNFFNEKD